MSKHPSHRAGLHRRMDKNRKGVAAVEFALVAPLFLIFFLGIVEFGRLTMVRNVMTQATRVGARLAILDGTTAAEVEEIIENQLASSGVTPEDLDIVISPANLSSAASGDDVSVTVTLEFSDISWLPLPSYFNDATFSSATTMRKEGF